MVDVMFESLLRAQESKRKGSRSVAMCDFSSRHRSILPSLPSCGEKMICVVVFISYIIIRYMHLTHVKLLTSCHCFFCWLAV